MEVIMQKGYILYFFIVLIHVIYWAGWLVDCFGYKAYQSL